MIYTIGYGGLRNLQELIDITDRKKIGKLVDVMTSPKAWCNEFYGHSLGGSKIKLTRARSGCIFLFMENSEYKSLMEFLGKKFEAIENTMATKDDIEDVKRHTGILIEGIEHKLDLLVEGRVATHQRIEKDEEENRLEHERLDRMSLINKADIAGLDGRVSYLEQKAQP